MAKKLAPRPSKKKIFLIFIGGILIAGVAFVLWILRPLPSPLSDGSGSCIIRGNVNIPVAGAPNVGEGYAKFPKKGVKTIDGLKSVCSKADFERLALRYCLQNSQPYQEEVVTYTDTGESSSTTCGAFGCDSYYCFNYAHNDLLQGLPYLLLIPQSNFVQPTPIIFPTVTLMSAPKSRPTPRPTFAPDQIKATFTFYIQATSHKPNPPKVFSLTQADSGKTFTVDIGTLIIVNFGRVGKFQTSQLSPQAIFTNFGSPGVIHLPNNALGAFSVFREGFGTITVIEAK